jgi:hypothetical protein
VATSRASSAKRLPAEFLSLLTQTTSSAQLLPQSALRKTSGPWTKSTEALFSLKPVVSRYNKDIDPTGTPQLGLVAEEVEKVNPDLVVRDKEGKPYSVRLDAARRLQLRAKTA